MPFGSPAASSAAGCAVFACFSPVSRWASVQSDHATIAPVVEQLLTNIRERKIEGRTGKKIGLFIQGSKLAETENFMSDATNRHRFRLEIDPAPRNAQPTSGHGRAMRRR